MSFIVKSIKMKKNFENSRTWWYNVKKNTKEEQL